MRDPVETRGRKMMSPEQRMVTVSVTVPRVLAGAMKTLAQKKRTSVSMLTRRCYQRLYEFHYCEKGNSLSSS